MGLTGFTFYVKLEDGVYEKDKRRLANLMAYGEDVEPSSESRPVRQVRLRDDDDDDEVKGDRFEERMKSSFTSTPSSSTPLCLSLSLSLSLSQWHPLPHPSWSQRLVDVYSEHILALDLCYIWFDIKDQLTTKLSLLSIHYTLLERYVSTQI